MKSAGFPTSDNGGAMNLSPGFRLSRKDAVVLLAGSAAALYLAIAVSWTSGFIVAFVLGHFFLFLVPYRDGGFSVWFDRRVAVSERKSLLRKPGK